MLDAATTAIIALADPTRLQYLLLGVLVGLTIGFLPGLGSLAGMAILLPFIYGLDPVSGIALLVGMMAVTATTDTFASVLLGVPGSSSSQATILDGYPMTKMGQGARALGAAFGASFMGGIFGALTIVIALPVVRPLVLALEAPELLVFALIGISVVGILAQGALRAGLLSATVGLLISCVGAAPAGGDRFTLAWEYLYGGVPLVLLALGLFAVPEFFSLAAANSAIAGGGRVERIGRGLVTGAKDAARHFGIVMKSSGLGVLLGVIPGVGGSAVQWLVYGTTQAVSKDKSKFGKGDVRGVIGPEASTNSVDAGTLMPTMFFGIPGSGTAAVFLAGLLLLGVEVGPDLMTPEGMPFVLTVVWSLAIANVIAVVFCFGTANVLARVSKVDPKLLLPFLFVILVLASYQASQRWGDVVLVFAIGLLGWFMKRQNWPRPPLLIGFVLGPTIERYLRISLDRYGIEFLVRPGVLVLAAFLALSIYLGIRLRKKLNVENSHAMRGA